VRPLTRDPEQPKARALVGHGTEVVRGDMEERLPWRGRWTALRRLLGAEFARSGDRRRDPQGVRVATPRNVRISHRSFTARLRARISGQGFLILTASSESRRQFAELGCAFNPYVPNLGIPLPDRLTADSWTMLHLINASTDGSWYKSASIGLKEFVLAIFATHAETTKTFAESYVPVEFHHPVMA
jgi:hypothetical protein